MSLKKLAAFFGIVCLSFLVSVSVLAQGTGSIAVPQVSIIAPSNGQVLVAGEITVEFMATGVEIKKADGQHAEGVGHYHLFLGHHPMEPKPGEPLGKDWIHTSESTHMFKDVKPGNYVLTVVLADGQHIPFANPAAIATVQFTVEAAASQPPTPAMPKHMQQGHMFLWMGLLAIAVVVLYIWVLSQ
jgi:hypothetical protein